MEKNDFKVGVIGTGWIAEKAAITLAHVDGMRVYAVGSRKLETAEAFAKKWNIERAYGSYDELLDDPLVDLVYVGTPHSHHFDVTMHAIEKGKACLVEKAFMANYREADAVVKLAREKKVFLAEAVWTRYQPVVKTVRQLIADGRIGQVGLISATIGYSMGNKPRIMRPDLCGGALLDLGVYSINFARMFHDAKIVKIQSQCVKSETGMDLSNAFSFVFDDNVLANLQSTACCVNDNSGIICGSEGYLIIDNINNPQTVSIYKRDRIFVEEIHVPELITGYEYEFIACKDAMEKGLTESPYMPLDETLYIMQLMDGLRKEWGVKYPMD